ncbi:hypothetical protein Hypma_000976 [Hypsizygus marmoreus]|uniref:BTB domain-containing protein n=1 Tax=Hypsizygus marmoreus TaxID=39966 RepID=A0A369JEG6_HYPMA|nr:hypothetical protein Hypma_000976 [Hypsizygus marmoreus]
MTPIHEQKPRNDFSAEASGSRDGLTEDEFYYFESVIFQVEDTLFKVPRHHFEQNSVVFRDMFTAPGTSIDGRTRERPLRLDGISKADFRLFLKVIFPKHFLHREAFSFSEWVSVLKLSTIWEFNAVRELAISTMTPMEIDPVSKIEVARAYQVDQWFCPALLQLVEEPQRPLLQDVNRLGIAFTLRVAELRGRVAGHRRQGRAMELGFMADGQQALTFIHELFPEVEVKLSDPRIPKPDSEAFMRQGWKQPAMLRVKKPRVGSDPLRALFEDLRT